jgi:hypothetical protein
VTWLTRLCAEEAGHDRSGRDVDELICPLVFRSEKYGDVLLPVGFRTNYNSCPRVPFFYMWAGGKARKPSALHDFPYTAHALLITEFDTASGNYTPPVRRPIDRQEADDLFLEALADEPFIGETLAAAMHKAVRWFGQSSWDDDTNILQLPEIRSQIALP